ncbi:hypothetical protein [uncultured Desulfobacter sp.]|uniref:hypothetical protein n=1 Tax=uncultured Desulfobacter sp. TaxID=240139 RepID=UPI0029F520A7|nr:hypothetical protein [uncultured Desulfobacter sp.]
MIKKTTSTMLILILVLFGFFSPALAGNKRLMSIMAAKVQASRSLVESIYGLKIRATESVEDMIAANYQSVTETKTEGFIKNIKFSTPIYDPKKDIAKVEASVQLATMENIDGEQMNLQNKVFRRVGYGTSTRKNAGAIAALRAAEIDAYKELGKRLIGMQVESKTSIENYLLKSDVVKTKLLATLYLAEVSDYGWEKNGDAFVNMILNVKDATSILGKNIGIQEDIIEVQGFGAQHNDFAKAKK